MDLTPWLNGIHCGDAERLLSKLPGESIDLVITSPPYDDLRIYGGHPWSFPGIATQLVRVLKPGGVIVWVVADATKEGSETLTSFKQVLYFRELGLNVHDTMIYEKTGIPFPMHTRYNQLFEFMFVLSKGAPKAFNPIKEPTHHQKKLSTFRKRDGSMEAKEIENRDEKNRGNIWRYATGFGNSTRDKIAFDHPAIFPEALAKDHIVSWSNPGDVVLDCFSGSGTTCKAAKELGRNFIGIDVNPAYCAIANTRLAQEVLALN